MEEVRCAGAWWVVRWCVVAGIRSGDNFGITVVGASFCFKTTVWGRRRLTRLAATRRTGMATASGEVRKPSGSAKRSLRKFEPGERGEIEGPERTCGRST